MLLSSIIEVIVSGVDESKLDKIGSWCNVSKENILSFTTLFLFLKSFSKLIIFA